MLYCKYCGSANADGSHYCEMCGGELEERDSSHAAAPASSGEAPAHRENDDLHDAPVRDKADKGTAGGAMPQSGPSGSKKTFLLIGSVAAFFAVLVSFGLFLLSGVAYKLPGGERDMATVVGFLSPSSDYNLVAIFKALFAMQSVSGVIYNLQALFAVAAVLSTFISLFVYLIMGIVRLVAAVKGKNHAKIGKTAVGAFTSYLAGMLLLNCVLLGNLTGLNKAALAGLCLSGILVGVNLLMRLLASENMKKALLPAALFLGVIVVGAVIAGLASSLTFKSGDYKVNMVLLFIQTVTASSSYSGNILQMIAPEIGLVAVITLISCGANLVRRALLQIGAAADDTAEKRSGLADAISGLIFSILFMVSYYFIGGAQIFIRGIAEPVTILVFTIVAIVLVAVGKKFTKQR